MRKYTNQDLIEAVANSTSIRQVLKRIQLKEAGGNYRCIKKLIEDLKLDTSHFRGQSWLKGTKTGPKKPLRDYLSNKYPIQSYKLKNRLIAEGYFDHRCSCCQLEEWLQKPIPLELDHIDGNHLNNDLSNLRLLCPNCHALTSNYRGKNKSSNLGSASPSLQASPNLATFS